MATWLKQSTSVDVPIGPFLDEADGKTAETTLTITQADIRLKKNNGNWAQKNAAQTLSHEENGWYEVTLDSTDTDTLGILVVAIHESGALPVWREFMVVPSQVWDSYLSTDVLQVDVAQFGNSNGAFSGGRPEVNTSHIAGSAVSTSAAQIGVNVVNAGGTAWASGSLTSGVFASGAITATAIAADAIGASELAADAIAEIADAVWDEDATGHQTGGTFGQAIGDPGADTDTIWGLVNTNLNATVSSRATQTSVDTIDGIVDDILLDTAEIGAAGAGLTNINLPDQTMNITGDITGNLSGSVGSVTAGVTVAAISNNVVTAAALAADAVTEIQSGLATATDLTTVDTVVDAIKAKTDSLTFTVAGQVDANIESVNGTAVTGSGTEGDPWGP